MGYYIDKGYSGSNTNRPDFQRLLSDVKAGKIRKVIIYKLDRMSRSLLDFAKLIEFFHKYKVEFQSTQEKFDTSTPIGRAMLSITMVFAQLERETIQQRLKDNYYARGEKGMYLGGKPPFGYKKIETYLEGKKTYRLEENPDQSAIVKEIFTLYVDQNKTMCEIGRILNEKGYQSVEGKTFYAGNISRMIRNPVYVRADADVFTYYKKLGYKVTNPVDDYIGIYGCFLYGKRLSMEEGRRLSNRQEHTLSIGLHEGFIHAEQFLAAQTKVAKTPKFSRLGTGSKSWIAGFIRCGFCGYRMSVKSYDYRDKKTKEKKAQYFYFSCNGRNYGACKGERSTKGLSMYTIEDVVTHQLLRFAETKKDLFYQEAAKKTDQANPFKIELAKVEQEIENLIGAVTQGNKITIEYLNAHLQELDQQKREIESKIESLQWYREPKPNLLPMYDLIHQWEHLTIEQKHKVAAFFLEDILVYHHDEGDAVTIQWKYNFLKSK